MKELLSFIFAVGSSLLLSASAGPGPAGEHDLVITAKSACQIVLPDEHADKQTGVYLERTARLLQKGFRETLGADFPVVTESRMDKKLPAIYLGKTRAIRALGFDLARFRNFESVILERGKDIYIGGNDHENYEKTQHPANLRNFILGTVKGTTTFMEDYLRTRFLMPGETGTDFARLDAVRVPKNLTRTVDPKLVSSIASFFDLFYNYATNIFGRNQTEFYGGHSYYDAVPKEKYAKTHPEYFILSAAGSRDPSSNGLCITHPEVQDLMVREALKQFDRGAEIVVLSQTDGFVLCRCKNCLAYGNTSDPGEKLWILHRNLAERIGRLRPGKVVMICSYFPNWEPPKSFHEFPENVAILLCQTFPPMLPILEKWKNYKVPHGFMIYTYTGGNYNAPGYTVQRTPKFCKQYIQLFFRKSDLDIKGIFRCSFRGENFGLEGPVYYIFGKLLENPDADEEQILQEYCDRAFHEAAPYMKTFYDNLYERVQLFSQAEAFGAFMPGQWLPLTNGRSLLPAMFPPDLLEIMETNLSRAEAVAKQPKVKKRLELVRVQFEYTKNLVDILLFYNIFRRQPTWENFNRLAPLIEKRNAMIDSWYDAGEKMKKFPGWPEIPFMGNDPKALLMQNGRLSAAIGAPLAWDVKLMRKHGVLPGTRKSLKIRPIGPGKPSLDPDSSAWKEIPWHELTGSQFCEKLIESRFKIACDDENLWFLVETGLPDKFVVKPVGHDTAVWYNEAVDLMIDPTGTRTVYYHLIYNPVADSYYDAAYGLVHDPLDPRLGTYDVSWNGQWEYVNSRKSGKWLSLVRIPFRTLNVKRPEKGDLWTLNIGREHYPTQEPKKVGHFQLWSPNLESDTFHDRNAFGEAVFE